MSMSLFVCNQSMFLDCYYVNHIFTTAFYKLVKLSSAFWSSHILCGYILWYQNILWCHRSISGISLVKWFSKLMASFSMHNLICSIRIYWASRHHCYHFCWPTGKVPSVSTPLQRWRGSWVLDGGKSKFWKNENNPKNQNFEKNEKHTWRYHHFTQVYQKL